MKEYDNRILIIGIGNCGRADDGLGWAFLDHIAEELPEKFDCEYRYQLQVEDAELISHYPVVYFVDAHVDQYENGFVLAKCLPNATVGFTTHELDPETVVHLSKSIYNTLPQAFILGISGVDFQLKSGISDRGKENLSHALDFFDEKILHLIV